MIKIDNLTPYQVEMLDYMWSLETEEDYLNWFDLLDAEDQRMAITLRNLTWLAYLDDQVGDCSDAKELLSKFVSQ